jgi:hypothetical protein
MLRPDPSVAKKTAVSKGIFFSATIEAASFLMRPASEMPHHGREQRRGAVYRRKTRHDSYTLEFHRNRQ